MEAGESGVQNQPQLPNEVEASLGNKGCCLKKDNSNNTNKNVKEVDNPLKTLGKLEFWKLSIDQNLPST